MESPSKKGGACTAHAPNPKLLSLSPTTTAHARVTQAVEANVDNSPLACSAQKSRGREMHGLLCHIVAKLSEIEAQLKSPLTARQLHLRYCARCGERVTNQNVGEYEGKSALTGRLYCDLCADEMEGLR